MRFRKRDAFVGGGEVIGRVRAGSGSTYLAGSERCCPHWLGGHGQRHDDGNDQSPWAPSPL